MLNQKKIEVSMIDEADCKAVWLINNDPEVRAMSFSQNSIPYKEHIKWFQKKLSDKNSRMYKFVIGNEIAGLIRLEVDQKQAIVNIAVKKSFRGRGVGSEILRLTIILAKELKLKTLLAEIKQSNKPSLKLFNNLGFLEKETILINKEKVAKLELNV